MTVHGDAARLCQIVGNLLANATKYMDQGGRIEIGAATTHHAVASSALLQDRCPVVADAAATIGDPQVRNRGTIGGSIANNDPAADYPAGLVGLGATVHTSKRQIPADDFFTGMFETALADDEIITAVRFQTPKRAGYAKFPNPASRYAMTGVFVADFGAQPLDIVVPDQFFDRTKGRVSTFFGGGLAACRVPFCSDR